MKKGIVALLVLLAIIVLVSPALIGRLAEKQVDENLNWAAAESGELVVTSTGFDRGWFSSEGQHRVEIRGGRLQTALSNVAGDSELPVLVIDTHLDHGLVPVTSMTREKGSLAPGLGSAISTLSFEMPDGETVALPGTIFSKVALDGELQSSYVLDKGSYEQDGTSASWDDSVIDVTTDPSTGDVSFEGKVGTLSIEDDNSVVSIGNVAFSGNQAPTQFGFGVGDMSLELDTVSIATNDMPAGGLKRLSVDATSRIDGSDISGHTKLVLEGQSIPQFGEVSVIADVTVEGADAEALGALQRSLEAMSGGGDPQVMLAGVEPDLKRLLAAGLELRFDQFDIALPMGTVMTRMDFKVAEEDPDTFDWSSLLLGTEASANVTVPEALVDMAIQMTPQASAVVGMGFLQKNGDVYEMEAEYAKGLLTINGAPMPIPMGGP